MQPWLHHHKELLRQQAKWMQCDTAIPAQLLMQMFQRTIF